jgi:4-alpha-glucanotransferase
MRASELRALARRYSIEPSYTDASGKKQTASRDALTAMIELRAGEPIRDAAARTGNSKFLEPVIVLWGTAIPRIAVGATDGTRLDWDLELDDGSWRAGRGVVNDGVLTLDAPLPYGYHTLQTGGSSALLMVAPLKARAPRSPAWGIFVPAYAAHTSRSWGIGDLSDLLEYAKWIDPFGGSVVATLPMLAAFDDEPSPYSPLSRLFWNELYIDLTLLPEFRPEEVNEATLAALRAERDVPWREARREKRRVLEACAERFQPDAAYEEFAKRARDYGEFRSRVENGGPAAAPDEASTRLHLYAQYRMAQQIRDVAVSTRKFGAGLYLDFPLGVHADGYDVWRYGHLFARGTAVGAPPDTFFTKGQNWGFPPLDPDAMREDRYAYLRAAIRHHAAHAGLLRLDHVMGLHRLYWIPEGREATDGLYVRYRAEELYAILVLESQRHGCTIVGEDLGTVPPEVPRAMRRHGLRRMYVVQYESSPECDPDPPARASVASLNTHDMPTFAAFWEARDVDDRLEQGLLDDTGAREERRNRELVRQRVRRLLADQGHLDDAGPEDPASVRDALLSFLASSPAELVLINLEDLWGETSAQNVPGVPERSWKQRFRLSLEEAAGDSRIEATLILIQQLRAQGLLDHSVAALPE